MSFMEKDKDICAGVFCLAIGIFAFFALDTSVGARNAQVQIGGVIYPRICAGVLMALAVGLLAEGIVKRHHTNRNKEQVKNRVDLKQYAPLIACLALILIWFKLLIPLGFIVATMLYIPFQMILLSLGERRNWIVVGICTIAVPIIVYYLFTSVFSMAIPAGILSGILQ